MLGKKKRTEIAMKSFLKENLTHILFLILVGMVLLLWGRLMMDEFTANAATKGLFTTKDRVRCAESFGWQVDAADETWEKVYIPKEFDDVYKRYNRLQKLCGFDLYKYRGKGVIRYTFRALNFPYPENAEAFVNILVYEGTMIGGDCMMPKIDGFMVPIDRRFLN